MGVNGSSIGNVESLRGGDASGRSPVLREWVLSQPPFRVAPESSRRIMATQLGVLAVPALTGWMFFGYHAVKIMLLALVAGGVAEHVGRRLMHVHTPGSMAHSLLMALLVALTLPATVSWYIVVIGVGAAVLLGKWFFGGQGHYVWQPALVGRLVVELFFGRRCSPTEGALLDREHLFWGNAAGPLARLEQWFGVDWFSGEAGGRAAGYILPEPLSVLRDWSDLDFVDGTAQMADYLLKHLPPVEQSLLGAVPGGVGETCGLGLVLVVVYLVYRGYVRWQLPGSFLLSAYLSAMVLPIVCNAGAAGAGELAVTLPVLAEDITVGFTYANYQLLSGGLLLGMCVMSLDMSSRPMTRRGQVIFAAGAGLMTMVFRLYTPMGIPCYAAILAMNSLVGPIDRASRPRGGTAWRRRGRKL